jgi:hypothetical protein
VSLQIFTSAVADGQELLETVHIKVFNPSTNPDTCEDGCVLVLTEEVPVSTLQEPLPKVGVRAANVAEEEQTVWLGPAFARSAGLRVIVIVDVAAGQIPLVTVHKREFDPTLRASTCVIGLVDKTTEPPPESTVHDPLPTLGVRAAKLAIEMQTVWSVPALATGISSRLIVTVDVAGGQTPFVTVHKKVLVPLDKAFTEVTGLLAELTLEAPEITDQEPVPAVGEIAAKVAEAEQTVWLFPALALGSASRTRATVEVLGGQTPLLTLHSKMVVPVPNEVTEVEGLFAAPILPLPDIRDQLPVPTEGAVALNVAKPEQTV